MLQCRHFYMLSNESIISANNRLLCFDQLFIGTKFYNAIAHFWLPKHLWRKLEQMTLRYLTNIFNQTQCTVSTCTYYITEFVISLNYQNGGGGDKGLATDI